MTEAEIKRFFTTRALISLEDELGIVGEISARAFSRLAHKRWLANRSLSDEQVVKLTNWNSKRLGRLIDYYMENRPEEFRSFRPLGGVVPIAPPCLN